MPTLNETPRSDRLHIGFFGKRNAGKSTLINSFTKQQISIVSDVAGTTTDPVFKSMEIEGLGACVLIDTAGFDDIGELGQIRVEKTKKAAEKTDIAVILFSDSDFKKEFEWVKYFKDKGTPLLSIISKSDTLSENQILNMKKEIQRITKEEPLIISNKTKNLTEKFKDMLIRLIPEDFGSRSITGNLVSDGDLVLLVMPQDIQAPKGRLILPQVQTIRDLLDKKCLVMSCTTDRIDETLNALKNPPKLIITDSQVFRIVYDKKPKDSMLTSFSTLFAGYKGDLEYYIKSAEAVELLTEKSRVLIAEACTHAPLTEDIGREKIPKMLRKKAGQGLTVDIVSGPDFPDDLSRYDLIIQCGACMFNRKYVLSRIEKAKSQGVAMSNYGVIIAYLNNILDKISY